MAGRKEGRTFFIYGYMASIYTYTHSHTIIGVNMQLERYKLDSPHTVAKSSANSLVGTEFAYG